MKDIGGYFELEHYAGQEYYPDLFKFNLGRTAITHFLKQAGCTKLYVPYFLCDSVTQAVKEAGIALRYYRINRDFTPCIPDLPKPPFPKRTWLFVVNYYGQLTDERIKELKEDYQQVLFDMTHAFFQRPLPQIDAVTSIRKFLGVSDGAYLQTRREIVMPESIDASHDRFSHLLGRFEENAGAYYQDMLSTAHAYIHSEAKQMSPLTKNLLKSFAYRSIAHRRMKNYLYLDRKLHRYNELSKHHILRIPDVGPFCYPLLTSDGIAVRQELAKSHIFVPTYWSNVITNMPKDSLEYNYAANILALPCDQRYDEREMDCIVNTLLPILKRHS